MDKQTQKQEAIKRMLKLKIMNSVVEDFATNGRVYYSERQNKIFNAVLYYLDNNEQWLNKIKDLERKYGFMVYHCQLTHLEMGDILSLLYVSKNEEEWSDDNEELKDGYTYAYVLNLNNEDDLFNEFGMIRVKPSMGGILRTE